MNHGSVSFKVRIAVRFRQLCGALLLPSTCATLWAAEMENSLVDKPGIGDCLPPTKTSAKLRPLDLPEWATQGEKESTVWTKVGVQWLTLLSWDEADRAFHEAEQLARNAWATWGRGLCRLHEPAFAESFFQEALRIAEANGSPEEKSFFHAWTNYNKALKGNLPATDSVRGLTDQLGSIQTKPEAAKFLFTLEVLAKMNVSSKFDSFPKTALGNGAREIHFTPQEAGWIQFHWTELRAGKPFKTQDFIAHASLASTPSVWRWPCVEPSAGHKIWFLEAAVRQRFSNLSGKPMHFTYAQRSIINEATALLPRLQPELQKELQATLNRLPSYPQSRKSLAPKALLIPDTPPKEHSIPFPPLNSIGPLTWEHPAMPDRLKKLITQQAAGKQWQLINVYIDHNCPRCMAQLTDLAKLVGKFSSESCTITCVGGDTSEEVGLAKPVDSSLPQFPFPLIPDPNHKISTELGCFDHFSKLPFHGTFLYDENLQLRWWIAGDMPFESLPFLLNELRVYRSK